MPELPDLEVFKTNIFARLTSKRLTSPEIFNPRKVDAARDTLRNDLTGCELETIERIGKELFFRFGSRKTIAVHLMLNGTVSIVTTQEAVAAIKYKIFALHFENESIVFSDMGALCTVKYNPTIRKSPDAFGDAFTLEYFQKTARESPRVNVKAFLIDQGVVKGIGNAYADEILWAARISPHSLVGRIPQEQLTALYHAIRSVLESAIASIKSISPDIITGEERSFLKVHNKKFKKTETGYPIIVERIASKTTYYTQEQVLYS